LKFHVCYIFVSTFAFLHAHCFKCGLPSTRLLASFCDSLSQAPKPPQNHKQQSTTALLAAKL
jgi:hypothetical protein